MNIPDKKTDLEDNRNARSFLKTRIQTESAGFFNGLLDTKSGKVCYAVLSFGGFLTIGEKLFAVPWDALALDTEHKCFVLNEEKDRLKAAPGFDKDNWPDMADETWAKSIHSYYGTESNTH